MGAVTMKLEALHKSKRMYWNLSLEGSIWLISMEMCVRVGVYDPSVYGSVKSLMIFESLTHMTSDNIHSHMVG